MLAEGRGGHKEKGQEGIHFSILWLGLPIFPPWSTSSRCGRRLFLLEGGRLWYLQVPFVSLCHRSYQIAEQPRDEWLITIKPVRLPLAHPEFVWRLPEPRIDLKTDSCLSHRTRQPLFACANLCQCLRMWRCERIISERFGHTCQNHSVLAWLSEKNMFSGAAAVHTTPCLLCGACTYVMFDTV